MVEAVEVVEVVPLSLLFPVADEEGRLSNGLTFVVEKSSNGFTRAAECTGRLLCFDAQSSSCCKLRSCALACAAADDARDMQAENS